MISLICCPLCRLDHHWLWLAARCSEFEQIVDGTDQRPFMAHRRQTAPQKLAKAARLLDLPEHRLDHLLAQPVGALITGSAQLLGHRRHPAVRFGGARCGRRRAVFLPAGGNMSVDLTGFDEGIQ